MGRNYIQLSKKMTRAKTNKRLRSILLQAQAIETHDDNACHTIAFSKSWNNLTNVQISFKICFPQR